MVSNMTLYVKNGGVWKPVTDLYIKQAGTWVPVQQAATRDAGVWKVYYQAEIVVHISANLTTSTLLSSLFSSGDWASTKNKRVIIDPGVTISASAGWGAIAMQGGGSSTASWGGKLTVENNGTLRGLGGVPNSGVGGSAIYDEDGVRTYDKKAIFINNGLIYAGGGAGGQGGAGIYSTPVNEGPIYNFDAGYFWVQDDGSTSWQVIWGSLQGSGDGIPSSVNIGGITYYKGSLNFYTGSVGYYAISRSYNTNVGSTGGNGGRGQGSDGNNTGGAGGGPNAGTGGAGGTWGQPGNAGSSGNNGGGSAGGAAGVAYSPRIVTMTNNGTILGRVT